MNDGKTDQPPPLPLNGLRVLDIATFIAAPYAATILGEFGAEIIKIEHPKGGDPFRRFGTPTAQPASTLAWLSEARNKQSLTLDLRSEAGAAVFKRLVAVSDVVCENFRPGTLEAWGLGWEVLSAINPGLVLLRVSGYGQTGPYRDRPGFARIAHAVGGLSALAGMPDGPPVTPGSTSLGDYLTGLYGTVGVLIALWHRTIRGGRGQVIDIGLYESVFRVLDELAPAYAHTGKVRQREGAGTLNAVPHGHFPTADGGWVAIACTTDKMFARLCDAMAKPELAAPDRWGRQAARFVERDAVIAIVGTWTGALPRDEVMRRCLATEVPIGPLNTIADIFADPQFRARGNLASVDVADVGPVVVPAPIPRMSETPGRVETLGPLLGASTEELLRRLLNLSEDDLVHLRHEQAI